MMETVTKSQHCELNLATTMVADLTKSTGEIRFSSTFQEELTMNAIAVNVSKQTYYDPFNGYDDLNNQRIRSVGEPIKRLSEDALRILRCYRFMDQGNAGIWWPENQLAEALRTTKPMLSRIASERIWSEFKRILLENRHHKSFNEWLMMAS